MTDTQLLDAGDRADIVLAIKLMAKNVCQTEACLTRCKLLIDKVLAIPANGGINRTWHNDDFANGSVGTWSDE